MCNKSSNWRLNYLASSLYAHIQAADPAPGAILYTIAQLHNDAGLFIGGRWNRFIFIGC